MNTTRGFSFLYIATLGLLLHGCVNIEIGRLLPGWGEESPDRTENGYAKELELLNLKSDRKVESDRTDAMISGEVKNNGRKTVTYAKINVKFFDALGRVVDNDEKKIINDNTLAPGETHHFDFTVKKVKPRWDGKVKAEFVKVKVFND